MVRREGFGYTPLVIVVVGAAAVDLVARRERFLAGTSNPAAVRWAPGGVGYRIWRRLPAPRLLLCAVGDDPAGRWLQRRIGPGAVLLRSARLPTACYCAFMESGRLLYGAADMTVSERGLSLARLRPHLPALGARDLLVLEANLSPALVGALLRRYARRTRVVFEGVSVEKLLRHEPGLRELFLLSVNREEAAALRARLAPQARGEGWVAPFLRERRIAHLLIPSGRRGVGLYWLEGEGRLRAARFAPAKVVRATDSTGAGDLLLAGLLARLVRAERGRGPAAPRATIGAVLPAAMREVEKALEEGTL